MEEEKFEPFDLARAQAGEPIQARDGLPVKFITYVPEANEPVVVISNGNLYTYPENGEGGFGRDSDLVMTPKKRKKGEAWTNIYLDGPKPNIYWNGALYRSSEEARDKASGNSLAIAHVTWEEPE